MFVSVARQRRTKVIHHEITSFSYCLEVMAGIVYMSWEASHPGHCHFQQSLRLKLVQQHKSWKVTVHKDSVILCGVVTKARQLMVKEGGKMLSQYSL